MKNLLENLKKAINLYERCEDVCAAEHIMAESLVNLSKCCKEVNKTCQDMLEKIYNDVKIDD